MEQNQNPQPPVFNQPPVQQPAQPQYQPRVTATPMMQPVEAIVTCFKKYFNFKGRARRSEYWWFILFVVVVSWVLTFLSGLFPVVGYLSMAVTLLLCIPQLAALTRRLHDTNHSGWWVLLMALGILGYYGSFAALLGSDIGMMAEMTDPMAMAGTIVDAIQANPVVATIMMCCSIVVIVLFIITLIFTIIDSKWGENKYGPSPKYQ